MRETENKRRKGGSYEGRAAKYLMGQGYEVLEMNYRCKLGEIDIIARDGEYLVFIEVKYRYSQAAGLPEEAVDWRKQKRISRVALYYCMEHGISEAMPCRFDVAAFLRDEIHLIRNAFSYQP